MNSSGSINATDVFKGIVIIVGLSGLYEALIWVAGSLTGAGHGTDFFYAAVLAPLSVSSALMPARTFLWPLVAVMLVLRRFAFCKATLIVVLIAHYLGVLAWIARTDWEHTFQVCFECPKEVGLFSVAYFGSQIFMWKLILPKKGVVFFLRKSSLSSFENIFPESPLPSRCFLNRT